MPITAKQIAMARILLDLSQKDLADKLGMARKTVMRLENNQSPGSTKTMDKIQTYFENNSIIFKGLYGVDKATNQIIRLKGQEGFKQFYEDFYTVLTNDKRNVCVSNSPEHEFKKYFGDNLKAHIQKVLNLGIRYKILIRQNDTHFITPEYAEYRWMPEEYYASVPFFVYGHKLAIFLFQKELNIIVIDYPEIAGAYRVQFEGFWKNAIKPLKS